MSALQNRLHQVGQLRWEDGGPVGQLADTSRVPLQRTEGAGMGEAAHGPRSLGAGHAQDLVEVFVQVDLVGPATGDHREQPRLMGPVVVPGHPGVRRAGPGR